MPVIDVGQTYMTAGIKHAIEDNKDYLNELVTYFAKYISGDWGNLCKDDIDANNLALVNNERILASYDTTKGKVYIITEHDRSYTTILFASEY